MKKYLCYLSIATFLVGCGQKKLEGVMVIDPDDAKEVMFEDVAENIKVVPLVCDKPLSGFGYLQYYGDELVMVDVGYEYVYYFKDHKLLGTLYSIGRGPGEYIMIRKVLYNKDRKILYVIHNTKKDEILQYSVPDMKYIGKIEMPTEIGALRFYDDKTLLISVKEGDEKGYYLYDLEKQEVKNKVCDLKSYQYSNSTLQIDGFDKDNHIIAMLDVTNSLCELTEDSSLDTLIRVNYGKDGAEAVFYADKNTMEDADKYLEYTFSNTDKFRGCYYYRYNKKEISFWYSTLLREIKEYRFFKLHNGTAFHLKGFGVPGLNKPIIPSCTAGKGYISVISDDVDDIIDPSTDPSPLAKEILNAISHQKDDEPIIVYYEIK